MKYNLILLFSFIISSKLKWNEYYNENEKKCIVACDDTEWINKCMWIMYNSRIF